MDTFKLIPAVLLSGLLAACGGDSGRQLPTPPKPPASSSSEASSVASSISSVSQSSESQSSAAPPTPDFDFESDTVGVAPEGLLVNPSAPEIHALVSDERAYNGTQSLKLTKPEAQNAYARYVMDGGVSTGSMSVAVYVSADADTAQTLVTLFGGDWAGATNRLIDIVFAPNGNLRVRPPGGNPADTGTTFTLGSWNLVEISWNNIETSQEFTLHFNGHLVGSFPVAVSAGLAPDRLELKYGQSGGTVYPGAAYFDDIYLPVAGDNSGDNSSVAVSSSSEAGSSSSVAAESSSETAASSSETSVSSSEATSSSTASSSAPAADFNFESDTLGAAPAGFDAVDGSVVVVSDEQAYTGMQSLKMSNTLDENVRVRNVQTSAASGSLQVAVFMPAGVGIQSFVTLYDGGYGGADRVVDIIFAGNVARELRNRVGTNALNVGNYLEDAWNVIDISWTNISVSNEFTLSLNGALIGTQSVVAGNKVPDRFELKFGQNSGVTSTTSIYFDDVTFLVEE